MVFRKSKSVALAPPPVNVVREGLVFGNTALPHREATGHFLLAAASGGGKTSLIRLLLQSAFPLISPGSDHRALANDPKQDGPPLWAAICPDAEVVLLNPFDARGAAWDLSADIREPRVAVEVAFTLIPKEHESQQPFFGDAARHLLYGVILSFMLSGYDWSFADLLRALQSTKQLKAVLKKHPNTHEIVGRYFFDRRLLANIMSTLATKVLAFEPIAACWESAARRVSLEEWSRSSQIYVLGNSEISRTAIDAVNRCIFKRAVDITLHQPESSTRRSWFILDEVSEAGRLDGLVSLLKKGRSKGAAVVLAFQSISGLRDQRMYGTHQTDEIVGQIANRCIGLLECHVTAEWASQLFGDQEVEQLSIAKTSSNHGDSRTETRQIAMRRAFLPVEFMNVPACNRENGLTGHYLIRSVGAFRDTIDGPALFDELLKPPDLNVPDFVPRPPLAQLLEPWTERQLEKFGLASPSIKPKRNAHEERPRNRQSVDYDQIDALFETE